MLGRTNLLFVAGDNTSELAFTPDYILTSASGNILKIEYINDLFFVFTEDEKVLYGSDMNNLQTLKNGNEAFAAKHIIYADGVYYLTKIEKTTSKAIIYKSSDLISYEVITLKTGTSSYSYPVHGLFLDSKGEIVVLIEEYKDTYSSHNRYLLIVDTLEGFQEESASFIEVTPTPYNKNTTAIGTRLKKDRIFTYINASSSYDDGGRMISLDGTMSSVEMYSFFALDYFFKLQSHSPSRLYYSLNGTDYISLEFSNDVTDFNAINVFEYGGTIALIYRCTENEETVTKLTTAATPKELIKATASAIPVTIDYGMIANSNVYVDEYAYLGSTGGIVIKGKIDNAETERPDVVVVKGMAAKEALKQANDYTDEKYKNITNEVELHEETTRQYMENAFSATPEGYAELVDTVSENKVKIDTIIEKADLRIKADASGEEIHLTDSDDDKVQEFALYGKAKQNTTTGKNLLDLSGFTTMSGAGVTFTNNGDGSLKMVGTPNDSSGVLNVWFAGWWNVKPNDDDSNVLLTLKAGKTYYIRDCVLYSATVDNPNKSIGAGIKTITEDFKVTGVRNLQVSPSQSYNTIIYPMVAESNVEVPWEPFTNGASPNPQYPQPIEVSGASGSVAVKSYGANILGYIKQNNLITNTSGVVETTNKYWSAVVDVRNIDSIFISGNYSLLNSGVIRLGVFTEYPTIGTKGYRQNVEKNKSLDVSEYNYVLLSFGRNVNGITEEDGKELNNSFMVNEGTTALPFEPYKETLSTIPTENGLAGIKVSSNGNYTDQNGQQWICDEVVKYADGSGEHIQRIGTDIITTTNSFIAQSTGGLYSSDINTSKPFDSMVKSTTVMCNYYHNSSNGWDSKEPCIVTRTNNASLRIYWQKEITNVNQAEEFLANNEVIVKYILAEPIHTPLTAEEIAEIEKSHTFYPITNISNDGGCGMKVTYKADSKNYIDRMVAEQVASIVANMNK